MTTHPAAGDHTKPDIKALRYKAEGCEQRDCRARCRQPDSDEITRGCIGCRNSYSISIFVTVALARGDTRGLPSEYDECDSDEGPRDEDRSRRSRCDCHAGGEGEVEFGRRRSRRLSLLVRYIGGLQHSFQGLRHWQGTVRCAGARPAKHETRPMRRHGPMRLHAHGM